MLHVNVQCDDFIDLLKAWCHQNERTFSPECVIDNMMKEKRSVYGALLYSLRLQFDYWEARDAKDNLYTVIKRNL